MATVVDIGNLRCFRDDPKIVQLNNLFRRFETLMPHQVSSVTGCTLEDSMVLLAVLYDKSFLDMKMLVYHERHPMEAIAARDVLDGFPELPILCEICGEDIESVNELVYDFAFSQKEPLQFTSKLP